MQMGQTGSVAKDEVRAKAKGVPTATSFSKMDECSRYIFFYILTFAHSYSRKCLRLDGACSALKSMLSARNGSSKTGKVST
jgi:hypothetical protein